MKYCDELDNKTIQKIEKELNGYLNETTLPSIDDVLKQCDKIVINTIVANFFIPAFKDRVGGKVTTLHNFKKGITANAADEEKYRNMGYNYSEDRSATTQTQKDIRNSILKSGETLISGYTGKELSKDASGRYDGRSQLEHIVSLKELMDNPALNLFLGKEDIIKLAYNDKNLTMIEADINKSKNDLPLDEWLNKKYTYTDDNGNKITITNAERFGIDEKAARDLDKQARHEIKKAGINAQVKKQGSELAQESLKGGAIMAAREFLAVMFIEIYNECINCVKSLINSYHEGNLSKSEFKLTLKTSLENTFDRIKNKFKYALESATFGALTGIETEIFSFLINNIVTLSDDWIRLLRETMNVLNNTIKILTIRDDLTQDEKYDEIARMIISELSITITIVLTNGMMALEIPKPIARTLAAIVVGVATVMITYHFELIISQQIIIQASVANTAVKVRKVTDDSIARSQRRKASLKKLDKLNDLVY